MYLICRLSATNALEIFVIAVCCCSSSFSFLVSFIVLNESVATASIYNDIISLGREEYGYIYLNIVSIYVSSELRAQSALNICR